MIYKIEILTVSYIYYYIWVLPLPMNWCLIMLVPIYCVYLIIYMWKFYLMTHTLEHVYHNKEAPGCISYDDAIIELDQFITKTYGYMFYIKRMFYYLVACSSRNMKPIDDMPVNDQIRDRIIIIAVGRKRMGKDTVADYLCKKYGFNRVAIADPLKEMARSLFGFNDDQLYGSLKDTIDQYYNMTPRYVFQTLGAVFCLEHLGKDSLLNGALMKCSGYRRVVFSDVRYDHDVRKIREYGAMYHIPVVVIKKNRKSIMIEDVPAENCIDIIVPDHLIEGEYVDLDELYREVDYYMARYM